MSKLILRSHDVRDTIERCMSGHPSENWSEYVTGWINPHYPVPAIDYYNSVNPEHIPIGNLMEWSIPIETQLKFRA